MRIELRDWQVELIDKYKYRVEADPFMCKCRGCGRECSREESKYAIEEEHISLDSYSGLCEECIINLRK